MLSTRSKEPNAGILLPLMLCLLLSIPACATAQQRGTARHQSDSEADGLKGRVKTVLTEYNAVTRGPGAPAEGRHQPLRTDYYDENGNLTRSLVYDSDGRPSDVFEYFFLNGERVYKTGNVQSKDSLPTVVKPSRQEGREERDPGYDVKLIYKYDARGNRVEELQYLNDGSLEARTVYEYDGKGMLKAKYDYGHGGELSTSNTYTYNGKGDITGETVWEHGGDSKGTILHKYSYTYEFDTMGNWIKRIESDAAGPAPPSNNPVTLITYRNITYY